MMAAVISILLAQATPDNLTEAQLKFQKEMRETCANACETALGLRRAGKTEGIKEHIEKVEAACRRMSDAAPALAEPHFQLGRMYRVAMRDVDALSEIEKAIKKSPGHVLSIYERAVLLSWEAQQGKFDQSGTWSESIADLERHTDALSEDQRVWVRAQHALSKGNADQAFEWLQVLIVKSPDFVEAYVSLALLERQRGNASECVRLCTAALERDRGYLLPYLARGDARFMAMNKEQSRAAGLKLLREVIEDFGEAVRIAPWRGKTWASRSLARSTLGVILLKQEGKDPSEPLQAAIIDGDEAVRLSPQDEWTWECRGAARLALGQWKVFREEDALKLYEGAVEDYSEALKLNPRSATTWMARGNCSSILGDYRGRTGNPTRDYETSIEDFGQALKLQPEYPLAFTKRGTVKMNFGARKFREGSDPIPLGRSALEDYTAAIRLAPQDPEGYLGRADAHRNIGSVMARLKESSTNEFKAALEDYESAVRLQPRLAEALRGKIDECRRGAKE